MRSIIFSFLFMMVPYAIYGQQSDTKARSGSPYSGIAFGLPADPMSSNSIGMGLTGVSLFDTYTANSVNPAMWGISPYTQGNISLGFHNYHASDGAGSAVYNQFAVDQFQLVLPLVRSRVGLSLAFQPVTRSNFEINRFSEMLPGQVSDPVEFFNSVQGSGGVNKIELGLGYRFAPNFSLGYAASLQLASLNREYNTAFNSPVFSSLNYNENLSGVSIGHRFGFYGRHSGLLGSNDLIAFGAALSLPVNIEIERSMRAFRDVGGQLRSVDLLPENSNQAGEIEIPLEFNLGLTYNPVRTLNISVEYAEQLWSQAEYSFNRVQEQYLVDRSKIGVGAQFHPYLREGSSGFFSNFKYSAGVNYDTGHLAIDDNKVETLMFHTGLGLISQRTASSIDLSFQFGFRGTEAQNMIKETIWGFKLSLNLAEWMFIQQRFQ